MAAVKKKAVKKVVKKTAKKVVKKVVAKKRKPRAPKTQKMSLLDVLHQKILLVEAQLRDYVHEIDNKAFDRHCALTTRVVEAEEETKKHVKVCVGQINSMMAMWEDQDHNLNNKYLDLSKSIMDFLGKHEPVDAEFMGKRLDTLQDAVQQLASRLKELLPELS